MPNRTTDSEGTMYASQRIARSRIRMICLCLAALAALAPARGATAAAQEDAAAEPDPDRWRVEAGLSVNSTGGNQQITMITSEVGFTHLETTSYEAGIGFRFRYGRTAGERVAENLRGAVNFDLHPGRRWSPFVFATAERDPFRRLDLRFNGGSGVKRTFWSDGWSEVSLSGAALYSAERLEVTEPAVPTTSQMARWSWRGRVRRTLGEGRRVEHVTFYQPIWDRAADYLLETRTSARFSLTESLAFSTTFLYERDSTPAPEVGPDDWSIAVGLSMATNW